MQDVGRRAILCRTAKSSGENYKGLENSEYLPGHDKGIIVRVGE